MFTCGKKISSKVSDKVWKLPQGETFSDTMITDDNNFPAVHKKASHLIRQSHWMVGTQTHPDCEEAVPVGASQQLLSLFMAPTAWARSLSLL